MRRVIGPDFRRTVVILIAVVAFVGAIWLGVAASIYFAGGWTLMDVAKSHDGQEQVELYTATRWQHVWNPQAEMLEFSRLSLGNSGEILGTSGPFDLFGGTDVIWFKGGVQVSTTAIFYCAKGKWDVLK